MRDPLFAAPLAPLARPPAMTVTQSLGRFHRLHRRRFRLAHAARFAVPDHSRAARSSQPGRCRSRPHMIRALVTKHRSSTGTVEVSSLRRVANLGDARKECRGRSLSRSGTALSHGALIGPHQAGFRVSSPGQPNCHRIQAMTIARANHPRTLTRAAHP